MRDNRILSGEYSYLALKDVLGCLEDAERMPGGCLPVTYRASSNVWLQFHICRTISSDAPSIVDPLQNLNDSQYKYVRVIILIPHYFDKAFILISIKLELEIKESFLLKSQISLLLLQI